MKKILLILLIAILFQSCGRDVPTRNFVISKIVKADGDNLCKYMGKGAFTGLLTGKAAIIDTCGKFNIGDTIRFVK